MSQDFLANTWERSNGCDLHAKAYFEVFSMKWLHENDMLPLFKEERLRHYEINWFLPSSGNIKIDADSYSLVANSIYCLMPGQIRNYQASDLNGYRIRFSADYLQIGSSYRQVAPWLDFCNSGNKASRMHVDDELQSAMLEIISIMEKEFSNLYDHRSEILAGLLQIVLIHLSRKLPLRFDNTGTKDAELVRQFKTSLAKNFISKKQVVDYASELCVSANYLNRTVKKQTGFTASYHIQQQIVMEAKRFAIHSNGSMKEIAYNLGFDNLAHFSKFFKNNCGINFTSYRKGLVFASNTD